MKFYNENIEKLREEKKLTRVTLSNEIRRRFKTRINPKTIENYENGETVPNAEFLVILCRLFNKPINVFFAPILYQSSLDKIVTQNNVNGKFNSNDTRIS